MRIIAIILSWFRRKSQRPNTVLVDAPPIDAQTEGAVVYTNKFLIDQPATAAERRGCRKGAGVKLIDVAKHMGISPAYLSELERGNRNWTEELFCKHDEAVEALK